MTMSAQEYKTTLGKSKVITGTADAKRVVSSRIKSAAERYYQQIGRSADLANYNWEFNLFRATNLMHGVCRAEKLQFIQEFYRLQK
jgi:hypothetical protein